MALACAAGDGAGASVGDANQEPVVAEVELDIEDAGATPGAAGDPGGSMGCALPVSVSSTASHL